MEPTKSPIRPRCRPTIDLSPKPAEGQRRSPDDPHALRRRIDPVRLTVGQRAACESTAWERGRSCTGDDEKPPGPARSAEALTAATISEPIRQRPPRSGGRATTIRDRCGSGPTSPTQLTCWSCVRCGAAGAGWRTSTLTAPRPSPHLDLLDQWGQPHTVLGRHGGAAGRAGHAAVRSPRWRASGTEGLRLRARPRIDGPPPACPRQRVPNTTMLDYELALAHTASTAASPRGGSTHPRRAAGAARGAAAEAGPLPGPEGGVLHVRL